MSKFQQRHSLETFDAFRKVRALADGPQKQAVALDSGHMMKQRLCKVSEGEAGFRERFERRYLVLTCYHLQRRNFATVTTELCANETYQLTWQSQQEAVALTLPQGLARALAFRKHTRDADSNKVWRIFQM